ncbi:unnamed protein product [Paramecium primaurelia]|uniref:Transmembrane protein n=1 Tax=Paramecium primaurelia TaxID=5886 RepID=A0A8S1P1G2_PARPR|nr:unnamed protein product [Paramecium primaurelia]
MKFIVILVDILQNFMKNQNRKGKPKLGQVCSLILFKSCSYIQKVQEIVISLLFNFSFFKRLVRCNAIKSGVKEIGNMFEKPSLNSCLSQLKKDYCIFQKGQEVMRKFFLFLKEISNISECKTKWSYNLNLQFHYSIAHANKYQYIQVFHNKAFEGFLKIFQFHSFVKYSYQLKFNQKLLFFSFHYSFKLTISLMLLFYLFIIYIIIIVQMNQYSFLNNQTHQKYFYMNQFWKKQFQINSYL